jgi:hypothetical protein
VITEQTGLLGEALRKQPNPLGYHKSIVTLYHSIIISSCSIIQIYATGKSPFGKVLHQTMGSIGLGASKTYIWCFRYDQTKHWGYPFKFTKKVFHNFWFNYNHTLIGHKKGEIIFK